MKFRLFMLLLAGAALFTSCDKNIGKIEAIAEKFAISVNNKDKVDIYYINPICRTYKYMNLPTMLNTDGINVEFNEEDSTYHAKYTDSQYLVFKVKGEDSYEIIDSYGILSLDSATYELAAQLGVPVKHKSDLYNAKLFNEDDSPFLEWIKNEYKEVTKIYLGISNGYYTWYGGRCAVQIENKITNNGTNPVYGEDYSVEYSFMRTKGRKDNDIKPTHIAQGVDLLPGESRNISFYMDETYGWAVKKNLTWHTKIVIKMPIVETLLKYGDFKGDEYDRFINASEQ